MPKRASKLRIVLVHWNQAEADERAAILRAAGYAVDAGGIDNVGLRKVRTDPPDAVVIDLSRIPSQGRDVGMSLRTGKATRHVPLVFVGGGPDKVAKAREQLPDAVFTDWKRIRAALSKAIARPLASPVVPASNLAGYSGTPLPKKLGIKPGSRVLLLGDPEGFEKTLGPLPEGATLGRSAAAKSDLTIWFVRSLAELSRGLPRAVKRAEGGPVWIAWTKKAAVPTTDLSETHVRERGLAVGLVDYKICAIDATWSGLLFALRRTKKKR